MKAGRVFKLCLWIISLLFFVKVFFLGSYPDFSSYYYGSQKAFSGGNPYTGGRNFFTPFVYPPPVLLIFFPLTAFPYAAAEKIWTVFSLALLFCSLYILFRMYREQVHSSASMFLTALTAFSFPVKFTLGMGQINFLILFCVILFLYFYFQKKDLPAGICLGFSIGLKLFPALFLLYILLKKKWKVLFWCMVTILFLFIIASLATGPKMMQYFFEHDMPQLATSWKGDYYNQAFSGVLMRFGPALSDNTRSTLKISVSMLAVAASLWIAYKNKQNDFWTESLKFGLLMNINLLINPFSWQHHFVWIIPSFFATFFYLRHHGRFFTPYVVLAVSYLLIAANFPHPSVLPILMQSHVFFGTLVLLGFDLVLLQSKL